MKESAIQKQITDLLTAERVMWFRMNVASFPLEYRGKKRFIRFGTPGMADLLFFVPIDQGLAIDRPQYVVWCETKNEKGKLSDKQLAFRDLVECQGHFWICARSSEDVLVFIRHLRAQS